MKQKAQTIKEGEKKKEGKDGQTNEKPGEGRKAASLNSPQ